MIILPNHYDSHLMSTCICHNIGFLNTHDCSSAKVTLSLTLLWGFPLPHLLVQAELIWPFVTALWIVSSEFFRAKINGVTWNLTLIITIFWILWKFAILNIFVNDIRRYVSNCVITHGYVNVVEVTLLTIGVTELRWLELSCFGMSSAIINFHLLEMWKTTQI